MTVRQSGDCAGGLFATLLSPPYAFTTANLDSNFYNNNEPLQE
jgi:hypothetical protein